MNSYNAAIKALYTKLQKGFLQIVEEHGLSTDRIEINSRSLSAKEAIGTTKRKDYPIITGKEIMLQAEYMGAMGQVFTDSPADFAGTLKEILELDIINDVHARGLYIASLNAVMRYFSIASGTVHCKNDKPELCAGTVVQQLRQTYGSPKIALVGFQPAFVENLSKAFDLRVLDLNPSNIGTVKYGTLIENGVDDYQKVVRDWAELVLCTGSTLSNGSIVNFIDIGKDVVFYGITIAGAAQILGLKRICPYGA